MSIYVEIFIRSDIEKVWKLTQDPALHERWDLRFTSITYLDRPDESEPQRFSYKTRLGLGLKIEGGGESVGTKLSASERTSSLKFWSDDPKSLILTGSGYWQYKHSNDGVVFATGYDYKTRFGRLGKLFDTVVFRPLIGWATAWSFDSMRLWIEEDLAPEPAQQKTVIHAVCRLALAASWIYQGVVPKLLYPQSELATLRRVPLPMEATMFVNYAGWIELLAGIALLALWNAPWILRLQNLVLTALVIGACVSMPNSVIASFGPVPLTISMIALGVVALIASKNLPHAGRCRRRKQS